MKESDKDLSQLPTVRTEPKDVATFSGDPWATVACDPGKVLGEGSTSTPPPPSPPLLSTHLPQLQDGLPTTLRFSPVELIAMGGMSEIWRCTDTLLRRQVVLKVARQEVMDEELTLVRFAREIFIMSSLQHPGIPAVYDCGSLVDGRPWLAMSEIHGRTLSRILGEFHSPVDQGSRSDWTLWRMVDILARVCEAVAYAHGQGVVHRDLKPDNVMVGQFGEVLVLDWGIAKQILPTTHSDDQTTFYPVDPTGAPTETLSGTLLGTPGYMAPELITDPGVVNSPYQDVYSLGAILYEILSGNRPHSGRSAVEVLVAASQTLPRPLAETCPAELRRVCEKAIHRDPARRFSEAGQLAQEVRAWLEQARRQEQARLLVEEADKEVVQADLIGLRRQAQRLRVRARKAEGLLAAWDGTSRWSGVWRMQEQAEELEMQADQLELRYIQGVKAALSLAPDLPEAHERLAEVYHRQHVQAEAIHDRSSSARLELLLHTHDNGRFHRYLKGEALLSVDTQPSGANVHIYTQRVVDRRYVLDDGRDLGRTPLVAVALSRGSYVLEFRCPGFTTLHFPIWLRRGEHWSTQAPGARSPLSLPLLPHGLLGENDVFIPPGWFRSGGDPSAPGALPESEIWLDGFVMRRFPVTNRDYLEFLNDLWRQGCEGEAWRRVPRAAAARVGEVGAAAYTFDNDHGFCAGTDSEGDSWLLDWPVMQVDWFSARAYAEWLAARTGLPWRLPQEVEWEKAARGVDGRWWPWGDHFWAGWCCTRGSRPGRPMLASVGDFPEDKSPYGVRGLAGNVRDWCLDPWEVEGVDREGVEPAELSRVIRGGYFNASADMSRVCARDGVPPTSRGVITGFRLVRSLSWPPPASVPTSASLDLPEGPLAPE